MRAMLPRVSAGRNAAISKESWITHQLFSVALAQTAWHSGVKEKL
jgi:hypothetical protein